MKRLTVISKGEGMQSLVMALMASIANLSGGERGIRRGGKTMVVFKMKEEGQW